MVAEEHRGVCEHTRMDGCFQAEKLFYLARDQHQWRRTIHERLVDEEIVQEEDRGYDCESAI